MHISINIKPALLLFLYILALFFLPTVERRPTLSAAFPKTDLR